MIVGTINASSHYEITAKAKRIDLQATGSPHKIFEGIVRPEQLLMLAVILQAIAEQDERFVRAEHGGERGKDERRKWSAQARDWVTHDMEEFIEEAHLPVKFLKALTPEQADIALTNLSYLLGKQDEPDADFDQTDSL